MKKRILFSAVKEVALLESPPPVFLVCHGRLPGKSLAMQMLLEAALREKNTIEVVTPMSTQSETLSSLTLDRGITLDFEISPGAMHRILNSQAKEEKFLTNPGSKYHK